MGIFRLKSSATRLVMILGLLGGLLVGCGSGGGSSSGPAVTPSIYVDAALGDDTTGRKPGSEHNFF